MTSNLPKTDSATSARRRLIKGGFAVPVALTVASGSALARTSSGCLARDAAIGNKPGYDTDNLTWHRVLAYAHKISNGVGGGNANGNGHTVIFWVRHEELLAMASAAGTSIAGPWISSGQAICVSGGGNGSNAFTAGQIYSAATSPALPILEASNAASIGQPRYYAVLMDATGNIVGVDQHASVTSAAGAVHQSCWNSFALSL